MGQIDLGASFFSGNLDVLTYCCVFTCFFFSLSIGCNFIPPKHALYRLVCCRGKLVSIRSSFLLFVFILSFF